MTILHIASITDDQSCGVNVIVPKHVFYQSKYANVALFNISDNVYQNDDIKVFNRTDIKDLQPPFNKPDLVIFHGIYYIKYIKIARYLNNNNIPYIVFPHGSLSKIAIKSDFFKFIKKAAAHILIFNSFIKKAKAIQFLSQGEKAISYFSQKGIIIPNGIETPQEYNRSQKEKDEINITFIGRKTKKIKGIDLLLKAVNKVKFELIKNNVKINIYGPNRGNTDNYINKFIKKNKLENLVFNHEAVFGESKNKVLENTDIFIHTSRTEGLPTAVIEAMSYGVPVLVTRGTGIYDDVKKYQCGWAAETNINSIAESLLAVAAEKSNFCIYGINARNYVYEQLSWDKVAYDAVKIFNDLGRKDVKN
ncbi:MAG TPA: glycosyltransferase [Clostridia bacterium]